LISLLSPWTHNRPSSRFSRLSNDIRNTARPRDLALASCLRQEPRHTLCRTASCSASRAVTPSCRLSARQSRIIFQATLCYIWYSRFNSRVAQTWRALVGDILLILRTFPFACRSFMILLNLFRVSLCFLPATNRPHCPCLSRTFHYKIPCT
jgi:hypothetical protein